MQVFQNVIISAEAVPGYKWSDTRIWDYALDNNLIIVSKDTDFEHRVLQQQAARVVLLCIGNMRRRDLVNFLTRNWPDIEKLCERTDKRLIKVFADRLEAH